MAEPAGSGCGAQPTPVHPCPSSAHLHLLAGGTPDLPPPRGCLGCVPPNLNEGQGLNAIDWEILLGAGSNFLMAGARPAGFGKGKQSPYRVKGCQSPPVPVHRAWKPPFFLWACKKDAHTSFKGKLFGGVAWINLQLTVFFFLF